MVVRSFLLVLPVGGTGIIICDMIKSAYTEMPLNYSVMKRMSQYTYPYRAFAEMKWQTRESIRPGWNIKNDPNAALPKIEATHSMTPWNPHQPALWQIGKQ
jgi:hypothetical protein